MVQKTKSFHKAALLVSLLLMAVNFLVTRDAQATSTKISFVPLTIKVENMQQILLTDSTANSVNATHFGWAAGETLITLNDGNNPVKYISLNRVIVPELFGKRRLEFTIGKIKGQNYTRTLADSVLVVIENTTNNQLDSL